MPPESGIMVNAMDNFLETGTGFASTLKLIETINRSTDDYLFIWDIQADKRWFFGDIDKRYDIRKNGSNTNSTPEMLKIIHPADSAAVLKSLQQIASGEKDTHDMDYRWVTRTGDTVWINCHGTVVRDNDNKPHLMLGRVSEEKLRHLYNPLTGLWNKNKLFEDLKVELKKSTGFLMVLDPDGLAAINLAYNRAYGDQLLKEVAVFCEQMHRVRAAYHMDRGKFALLLQADSEEEVRGVYEYIKAAMQEKCTFTAGAVPVDKTLFFDETQLLDSVNITLKKAKRISRNCIAFFSAEDLSKKIASLALLEELKQSVKNDYRGFELYYQPQVRAGNYALHGVEALLRYNSPTRGRVFPDEFIPILEQSRLIKEVGLWVLRQALAQCKQWREALPDLRVGVNFSALQFEDMHLAEKVIAALRERELNGDALTVEITESMELRSSQQLVETIHQLKAYNINLSIDDFGTGYANLSYLKELNVDELKIDRSFVSGLEKDTYNHKLISNVIEFARDNAIRTCCEGVETTRDLVALELLLPDLLQGYLFDRPTTQENIEKAYIDQTAPAYRQRIDFINKIYDFKDEMGIVYFDPKDILRENEVGLWLMRINPAEKRYELHVDNTMERLLAFDGEYTPKERYERWYASIHPDYAQALDDALQTMMEGEKAVQIEFPWLHAKLGDVMVRFSGKRVQNTDGMTVLEGYCRIITDVTGA